MESTLSNKELRLLIDSITDDYRKVCVRKPLTDYIQLRIFQLTGLHVAKSTIINVEPFKKIKDKIVIIAPGKVIKVLRRRNKNNRHNHYKRV